jgi:hypothetical protein
MLIDFCSKQEATRTQRRSLQPTLRGAEQVRVSPRPPQRPATFLFPVADYLPVLGGGDFLLPGGLPAPS